MTDPDALSPDVELQAVVQGGRNRGLILHKLMEEVLTGETGEDEGELRLRAQVLIHSLGETDADAALGLSSVELARSIARTLALPEVVTLRPGLLPEFPIYDSFSAEHVEEVTSGVVDAIAVNATGDLESVIDWKSDVNPSAETIRHYRSQVGEYLKATGLERGLVVFMSNGQIVEVQANAS